MTNGWRLYVGRRNCSASCRRGSGLDIGARDFLVTRAARTTSFFLEEAFIMPPRVPLARLKEAREGREFPGWKRNPGLLRARPGANRQEKCRRRCGLRGHRL